MDTATRSRLLSLATTGPRAKPGVTGVTGVTGYAAAVGSSVSHLPLHLERAEKAQSDQGVTPVTPRYTPKSAGIAELSPPRCDTPAEQGVTALVTPTTPAVGVDDWQAVYDERAAIREQHGKLSRAEAGRLAFENTVTHWLCLHPAPATDPHRGCVQCGEGDQTNNTLLPVLAHGGHVWVHDQCWEAWNCSRRHQAEAALRELRARRDRT